MPRVVFGFCVVLGMMLPSCIAISATITANSETVEKGSDINIRCILDLTDPIQRVDDVLWLLKDAELPSTMYKTVNENISELTVVNATFNDAGNYACGFSMDNYYTRQSIAIYVGLPPDPAQNLTCSTSTMEHIYCQWNDSLLDTKIRNTDDAFYRKFETTIWEQCNSGGDDSCDFESEMFEKYDIRVTTSNALGSSSSIISFDQVSQVTPNPPTNVNAVAGRRGDIYVLDVTWTDPDDFPTTFFSLDYRVHYSSISTTGSKDVPSGFKWTTLEDLTPYTEYTIKVSARSIIADPSQKSLYWSEPAEITAVTMNGAPSGDPSDVKITNEVDSATKHYRIVELKWDDVPQHQWGSPTIQYKVSLIPQDLLSGLSLDSHQQSVVHPVTTFYDLDKYQTYKVKVHPYNGEGEGEVSDFGNVIPDRTSEPSPPRNLNVTLDSSSILSISWDTPQNPNGLIHEYEVRVSGNSTFSFNNETDQEDSFKETIPFRAIVVSVDCKELTEESVSMQVWVLAVTKNYTNHLFRGSDTTTMIHDVCTKSPPPSTFNPVLVGIIIPTTIIVSCIIALVIWNFFKDTCKAAPEPHLPSAIMKDGKLAVLPTSTMPPVEKELFDNPKPKKNMSLDIEAGLQQTNLNPYHTSPRNDPKYGIERNNSHDSGVPESPVENTSMHFTNSAFEDDETTDNDHRIPSISRTMSEDDNGLESLSWRNSCFSDGSQDSGAVVRPGSRDLGPMSSSSPTDDEPKRDPLFKLTSITDPKIGHGPAELVEDYVKQCRLADVSPIETNVVGTPYMAMAPLSPPPITTSVPNGYIATELLPKSSHDVPQKQNVPDNVPPENYSKMTTTQESLNGNGYLPHNATTTNLPPVLPTADYIKHDSLSPKCTEYQDSYPDFNQNNMIDEPKMNHQGYITHKMAANGPPNHPSEMSSDSVVGSTNMPYSKLSSNE